MQTRSRPLDSGLSCKNVVAGSTKNSGLNFQASNCFLIVSFNGFQRKVLVDFKRLSAFMTRDELDFGIAESLGGQERKHMMPQQVRMYRSLQTGLVGVFTDNLLDAPGSVWLF